MTPEQNAELTRRFIAEVLNTNNWAVADDYLAPDYVEHSAPPGMPATRHGTQRAFAMLHSAFPDFKYTVDDTVVLCITASGTMQGTFLGWSATGKHAAWPEMHIVRLKDGKITEHWNVKDRLT